MSAGLNGRMSSTRIAQLIGILPSDKCRYNRVGHVWTTPLYLWDNDQKYPNSDLSIDDMYEFQNDASSLKDWFPPKTHYKLKCPLPTLIQDVELSTTFRLQDVYQAGTLAGGITSTCGDPKLSLKNSLPEKKNNNIISSRDGS
eukprot:8149715-Pyramimonas_sp.AAC.1